MASWDLEAKNPVRRLALQHDKKTVDHAFLLPGDGSICVDTSLEIGSVTKKTNFLFAECNPNVVPLIHEHSRKAKLKYNLFCGKLQDMVVPEKLDFAFFDVCDQLNRELVEWFTKLRGVFTKGATVSFTFSLGRHRSNSFIEAFNEESQRLYWAMDAPPTQMDTRLSSSEEWAFKPTVTGVWASLAVNYTVAIQNVVCYRTSLKTAMMMVKMKILSHKPSLGNEYLFPALNSAWLGNRTPITTASTDNGPVWKQIGCHPVMPDSLKRKYVASAKRGERPPWMKPQVWAWHSVNPGGIRRAA